MELYTVWTGLFLQLMPVLIHCELESREDMLAAIRGHTSGIAVKDLDNDGLFEVIVAV